MDILGTDGNNRLIGTDGDDSIAGFAENDSLEGLAGNNILDGGTGLDINSNAFVETVFLLRDNFDAENNGSEALNYSSLVNWNITDGTVDLIGNGFFDLFPENGLYLDLDGSTGNAGRLESKTTLDFSSGDVISLSFNLGGNSDTNSVTVSLGDLFNETFTLDSSQPLTKFTRTINANEAASANLVFDHEGGDNRGLILDSVELSKTSDLANASEILSFTEPEFSIKEDGTVIAAVTVTRTGGIDGEANATVNLADGTAIAPNDYNSEPIRVVFAAGETSKTITIPIKDDLNFEETEALELTLIDPINGVVIEDRNKATVNITDNEINTGATVPEGQDSTIINRSLLAATSSSQNIPVLSLDGVDDYLAISNFAEFPTKEFTIEGRFKRSDNNDLNPLFSYAIPVENNELLIAERTDDINNLSIHFKGTRYDTDIELSDQLWHNWAFSWRNSDGEFKVYLDGEEIYRNNFSAGENLTSGGTLILGQEQDNVGSSFDSNQTYKGQVEEVRIWNKVRTEAEIKANLNSQLKGDETNLVGYWNFRDVENNLVLDRTENDNDGQIFGANIVNKQQNSDDIVYTVTELPKFGNLSLRENNSSLTFDGVDDYVNAGDSNSLKVSDALTIEAWIKPTGSGSSSPDGGIIVNKEGEYEIARFADGIIQWALANSDPGWVWVDTGYVAPLNKWTHIALTYDGERTNTYADGVLVDSQEAKGNIRDVNSNDQQLRIGDRQSFSQHFEGNIDNVRVWDIARTPEEIEANFDKKLTGNEEKLIGNWKFDGNTSNVALDSTGNNNDGIIVGANYTIDNPLDTSVALKTGDTFTQADIDNNRLIYESASDVTNQDSFKFTVSDGNTTSNEQTFEITNTSLPVDLSNWEQQGLIDNGDWQVIGDQNQFVEQSINGEPTFFVSPFDFIDGTVTGTFQVNESSDDDYIGFVFGYQSPVDESGNAVDDYEFLLFDWKQSTQDRGLEGFTLSRLTSPTNPDFGFQGRDPSEGLEVLDTDYSDSNGWNDFQEYEFSLTYTEDRILIKIDDETVFDVEGSFDPGRFGFYNYSQPFVRYGNFRTTGLSNINPVATEDSYQTNEDVPLIIDPEMGLLANDISLSLGTLQVNNPELITATENGTIALEADGSFVYTPNKNFAGEDSFTYRIADGNNISESATVTLQVENVDNDAPTRIILNNTNIDELTSNNTTIATLINEDPDPNDTHTYTLLDNAGDRFKIEGNELKVADETLITPGEYPIVIEVTDAAGATLERTVNIVVNDVDFAPDNITLDNNTIAENTANNTVVGELNTVDRDTDDSHIYSLIDDAGGRFALDGNKLIVANGNLLDYETNESHQITVRTTDNDGLFFDKNLTIQLTDLPNSGTINFDSNSYLVDEDAGTASITLNRTGGTEGEIRVTVALEDGTANSDDYLSDPIEVVFGDRQTNKTITIPISDDLELEENETVNLTLINPQNGAVLGEPSDAVLTIEDNDSNSDLIVSALTYPPEGLSGQDIEVSWTITNQGDLPIDGNWSDRISFVSEESEELTLGEFPFEGTIEPGKSITRTQIITLPVDLSAQGVLKVETDIDNNIIERNDGNNTLVGEQTFTSVLAPFPNLVVTNVDALDNISSRQNVEITWTVENVGTGATNSSFWNDRIWLSRDTELDSTDILLDTVVNPSFLGANQGYTNQTTVDIPNEADIQGTYHILVETDESDRVFELGNEEDNVTASSAINIEPAQFPDLVVINVNAPDRAFSQQTATISYEIENIGDAPVSVELDDDWQEQIFLSEDDIFDSSDILLPSSYFSSNIFRISSSSNSSSGNGIGRGLTDTNPFLNLDPGESEEFRSTVQLPVGISGDFYFFVVSDPQDIVEESAFEGNNFGFDPNPTQISLTPPPDLEVSIINAPTFAEASRPLTFRYQVTNFGSTATPNSSWIDSIYLSEDEQLDPEEDLLLGNLNRSGRLTNAQFLSINGSNSSSGAQSSYTREANLTLPDGIEGEYYLFVVTDSDDRVFELDNENNVTSTDETITIVSRPADLVVNDFSVPNTAETGNGLLVEWTVANQGQGDTAVSSWSDRLIASVDDVVGNEDDVVLRTFTHEGLIDVGESYDRSATVTVPISLSGDYNLFLVTDSNNNVFETEEGNNNSNSQTVAVTQRTADLQVENVTAANSGRSGENLSVSWSVVNQGTNTTNANFWYDEVFLSTEPTLSEGNFISLGRRRRSSALQAGDRYEVSQDFELPIDIEGDYYVIVRSDTSDRVLEVPSETNNTNSTAETTTIELSPVPDLQVVNVAAPAEGVSGQNIDLTWTVSNSGADLTGGTWRTAFYISRDPIFDRNSDEYIGFANQNGTLLSGEALTQSESLEIPAGLSGNLYVFAVVDSGDRIYEREGESNNVGQSGSSIEVILPPPADLVIGTITVPANGVPGEETTIDYIVENLADDPAIGTWTDSIYISADPEWDVNDPLLGTVETTGPVDSGESYSQSLTASLPGVTPGEYYVIVRSDIRNAVIETDEVNNIDASDDTFPVDTNILPLGELVTGNIEARHSIYYRIDVEAGETLNLNFDSGSDFTGDEIYLSYGEVPSRSEADFSSNNGEITVANTRGGTYYVLAYKDSLGLGGETETDFNIEAEILDFSITDISTDLGSNRGEVSTVVSGAKFTTETEVFLVTADGSERPATEVLWKDSTELWTTFDLEGLEPGSYDIRVRDGEQIATIEDEFTVTNGALGDVEVGFSVPPALRPGQQGVVTISYKNTGETDVQAPLITLSIENASLRIPGESEATESQLRFLGINDEGAAGILPPGASGTINVIFEPNAEADVVNFSLSEASNSNEAFDLDSYENIARPEVINDADWNNIWQNFTDSVGFSVTDYQEVLAENATQLSLIDERTNDVPTLINFEFLQASDYGSLLNRNQIGNFGIGQTPLLDITATVDPDGNVVIQESTNILEFELQPNGTFSSPSEVISLVISNEAYVLTNSDGSAVGFRPDGKVDYIENSDGNRTEARYTDGQLTELVGNNGETLTLEYNEFGRISQISDSVVGVSTFTYDETGEFLLEATTPNGTIEYSYVTEPGAAQNAIRSITLPDGTQQVFDYNDQGRIINSSLSSGSESITYEYDTAGGVTITDANGAVYQVLLNNDGAISRIVDPFDRVLQYRYDDNRNLTEVITPDDTSTTYEYDEGNNLTLQTDALGNEIEFTYDTIFNDQVASVTDARGNAINYTYSDVGDLTGIIYADESGEQYNYDVNENLIEYINRRGQSVNYTYDEQNRVTSKIVGNELINYTYDERGNLATATDSTGITSLEYDDASRLTKITYPNGKSVAYSYDEAGRRTQTVDQDGFTVNYSYNDRGRLAELTDRDGNSLVTYQYDDVGNLIREDNGNGTYTIYEYDIAGQATSVINYAPDGTINSSFEYTYDNQDLRTSMTTLEGTFNYGYDALGQLTSVTLPDGETIEYQYDAVGNRIAVTENGEEIDYASNNLNQYTSAGDTDYIYDTDGNLISKTENGQTTNYTYDIENRLVGVETADGSWQYEYDVFGNRIATVQDGERAEYLVDPLGADDPDLPTNGLPNVIGEYDSNGNLVANYAHGLGLETRVDGSSSSYFDFDALGSTAGLSGGSGQYQNSYSYDPFGRDLNKSETISNPFEYVGQWGVMDEGNGLDFMRARFYDPVQGRFISPDPIGINGGLNLYQYVQNNPTSLIDPSGLAPCWSQIGLGTFNVLAGAIAIGLSAALIVGTAPVSTVVIALAGTSILYNSLTLLAGVEQISSGVRGVSSNLTGGVLQDIYGSNTLTTLADSTAGLALPGSGSLSTAGALSNLVGLTTDIDVGGGCEHPEPPDNPNNPSQNDQTDIIRPMDPNDILGPEGFGDERWITTEETLPYTIRFENQATATAPAQEVVITHPLDPDVDFRTFRLGSFGWGEYFFEVPEGQPFYQERLDLTEEEGFIVEVFAGVDVANGEAFWRLTTIDPETGETPENALTGFLPPNNDEGVGDGFVTYTIESSPDASTGDVIDAEATIVFDTEEPIDTPPIFNTIDAGVPTSTVEPLSETSDTGEFLVQWSGSDDEDGSAIASFDIFVSIDGGEFVLWQEDTTLTEAIYPGEAGRTYSFYAVATDNAGNREATPTEAQATIQVTGELVDEAPFIATNNALNLDEGATEIITASILEIGDLDNSASEIVYTIENLPENGTLSLDGNNLTVGSVFTQADINRELLRYEHDGEETIEDSFSFTAEDTEGNAIAPTVFEIDINSIDDPPIVANAIADLDVIANAENTVIDISGVFSDVDNEIAIAVFNNTNEDLVAVAIEDNNLILDYQGDQSGTAEITLQATSNEQTVEDTFTVNVEPIEPLLLVENPLDDIAIDEDAENTVIDIGNVFSAADGESITFSLASNSNESLVVAEIEGNNLVLDYQDNQFGTSQIAIEATVNGLIVEDTFTINVNPVDDAPIVANAIADVTVEEDAENITIDLSNVFTDVDNDDLRIVKGVPFNSKSSLVKTDVNGDLLTLDFQDNQSGTADITVRGRSNGQIVEDIFTVNVNPVDDAPTVTNPIADVTVEEDAENITIDLSTVFTDIDNDDIRIVKGVPFNSKSSLVKTDVNGDLLTLDFQDNQSGTANITVRGRSGGQIVEDIFTVNVNPVDDAPIVANAIADVTVEEDAENITIDLSTVFTDIDNDDIRIVKGVPFNSKSSLVKTDVNGDLLTLDFQDNQSGTANITVRGRSGGQIVEDIFTVNVNPVDDAPIVANAIADVTVEDDDNIISSPPEPFVSVFGTQEADVIEVEGSRKLVFAGDGDDLIDLSLATGGNRVLAGDGNDSIFAASGGNNIINEDSGEDQFWIAVGQIPESANIINDFVAGEDVIGIAGLDIGYEDLIFSNTDEGALISSVNGDLATVADISAEFIANEDYFVFG